MNKSLVRKFVTVTFLVNLVRCANILGVFPAPGYSQFILCEKLMTNLARRGHNVTVISAYEPKGNFTNYSTILVDTLLKAAEEDLFNLETAGILRNALSVYQLGYFLTETTLSHQSVQNLLNSNTTFDLVIVEQFFNEAHKGFAEHFKAPLVVFCSIGLTEWNSHLVGNVPLPSVQPFSFTSYTSRMSFFQRLQNSFLYLFDRLYKEFVAFPQHQMLLNKYFRGRMLLKDVMHNTSLLLTNSHVTVTGSCTKNSAVVEIGGFHITSRALPRDLQDFLDSAKEGAVLFSLGTNLRSSNLSKEKLATILRDIGMLKQKVLWKFESNDFIHASKPANLLVSNWLPQNDILEHPNTIAFITHGGLLSITEATLHGVPMVGIPVFGDQKMNVARMVQNELGILLSLKSLERNGSLYEAVMKIVSEPKFQKNIKKYSELFKDEPIHPLELAMFNIEYVIRHNGAPHLKHSALDLAWYQLYLVDVIIFTTSFLAVLLYLMGVIVKKIVFRRCKNKRTKSPNCKQKLH